MSGRAQLSVIIPVLDEATELPRLLDELNRQDLALDVVVADGGSQDASCGLAEAAGATVVKAQRGRAAQMNAGARRARAPRLLFLHADSHLPDAAFLRRAVEAFDAAEAQDTCTPVAGHFGLVFHCADTGSAALYRWMEAKSRSGRAGTINGDQGLLLRPAFFRALGGFDESHPYFEDQRMARRIFDAGRWVLLPGRLGTSARRFESEGRIRRYAAMGLMVWMHDIGLADFFDRAQGLYREQSRSRPLDLRPLLVLAHGHLVEALARDPTLAQRMSEGLRAQAWQPLFAVDVLLGWEPPRLLRWFDRTLSRRLARPDSDRWARAAIAALLVGLRPWLGAAGSARPITTQ